MRRNSKVVKLRAGSIRIFCLVILLTLSPVGTLAQEERSEPISVYDASTVTAEKPEVKSLTFEEFSAYATEICKKYEFDGPKQVNNSTDQTELYQKLTEARKVLFTRLCDPEVRKDLVLKEKLQSQMKSLTEDIRSFPELAGFGKVVVPPTHKERIQASKETPPRQLVPPGLFTNRSDSISTVRDQIKKKHGKYYVPLVPKK